MPGLSWIAVPQGCCMPGAQDQLPCVPLTEKRKDSTRVSSLAVSRVRIDDSPTCWPFVGYSIRTEGGFVSGGAFGMEIIFVNGLPLFCPRISSVTAQTRAQARSRKTRDLVKFMRS